MSFHPTAFSTLHRLIMQPALLLAMLLLCVATATRAETLEDGRAWLNLTAEGDVTQKWRWYLEFQPRFKEEAREFDQYIFRPGIQYRLSSNTLVGGGYAYVRSRTADDYSNENRIWQQIVHSRTWREDIQFVSRSRLEQRFLDTGDDMGLRYRQLLRVSRPLSALPSVSPLLWNELFINLKDTDWGAQSGFDQNRLFAGIAWRMTPDARLEFGYLNQYVRGRVQDSMNHVLSTSLLLNF